MMVVWEPRAAPARQVRNIPQSWFVPDADPRDVTADRWSATSGFEAISVPPASTASSTATAGALEFASHLTGMARKASEEGNEGSAANAASLHVVAAELRREAGRWALCVENYEALVRHYLWSRDFKAAMAYLHRLTFVAGHARTRRTRVEADLLATEVRLAFGDVEGARKSAASAARHALDASDFAALARAAAAGSEVERAPRSLAASFGRPKRCFCGGARPYAECCAAWDRPPTEFLVRAVGLPGSAARPAASPWLAIAQDGIDLMMQRPDPSGESRYWVSHGVRDGRHFLAALPNWSARAMESARAMHEFSIGRPNGCEGPSSAILQVTCALEAFINTALYFIAHDGGARWLTSNIPVSRFKAGRAKNNGGLHKRWIDIGGGIFGEKWTTKARLQEFELLTRLRGHLCHFKEDGIEEIDLADSRSNGLMSSFEELAAFQVEGAIRPGPGHWIDRILTPHLAGWAVGLGEDLIASFRTAWEETAREEAASAAYGDGEAISVEAA